VSLDPECLALVEAARRAFDTPEGLTLDRIRRAPPPARAETLALVKRVDEEEVPGPNGPIPTRLYWPDGVAAVGAILFFYGGGFISGSLDKIDGLCRLLASASSCVVISAAYRLAPEWRFPAGAEDAYAASQWAVGWAEARGLKLAVGGESAGGTLATVACMMARDRGGTSPAFQLLVYPGINLTLHTPERTALAEKNYLLSMGAIDWLNAHYCERPEDFANPYCAPVHATNLAELPPALIVTGEYDPLRFENQDYATRLAEAGVPVEFRLYPGAVHGFINAFENIALGRQALIDCARTVGVAVR
jgi:acetyl esterase